MSSSIETQRNAWKAVTGVQSDALADRFLEMSHGDVNRAVSLFFENQQQPESRSQTTAADRQSAFSVPRPDEERVVSPFVPRQAATGMSVRRRHTPTSSASATQAVAGNGPANDGFPAVAGAAVAARGRDRRRQAAPRQRQQVAAANSSISGCALFVWHYVCNLFGDSLLPFISSLFNALVYTPLKLLTALTDALGLSDSRAAAGGGALAARLRGTTRSEQAYLNYFNDCALNDGISEECRALFALRASFRIVMNGMAQRRQCCALYFHNDADGRCHNFVSAVFGNQFDEDIAAMAVPRAGDLMDANGSRNDVADYLRGSGICLWFAEFRHREALQLWGQITAQMDAGQTITPLICVCAVHPTNNRLLLLHRQSFAEEAFVTGTRTVEARDGLRLSVINALDTGMQKMQSFETERVASERQVEHSRSLREVQNEEYLREVRLEEKRRIQDAKDEAKMQEVLRVEREESEKTQEIEEKKRRLREEAKRRLSAEPTAAEASTCCMVRVRLPNGKQVSRRFRLAEDMDQIFFFVESHELVSADGKDLSHSNWNLMQTVPRRQVFVVDEAAKCSLAAAGFDKHGMQLFVQCVEANDDDESDE